MSREDELVEEARVTGLLPAEERGLWRIGRYQMPEGLPWEWESKVGVASSGLEPGESYTALLRLTDATVHVGGEIVMEDSRRELRRHLPILRHAHGRVLVTGLGLGCVVRGLLSKPEVEHVDVIEVDPDVAGLVWPHLMTALDPNRVRLHIGDALTYKWLTGPGWDFAWHDIWCEGDGLHSLHGELMVRYHPYVRIAQGAWQFPRLARRVWRDNGLPILEG